MGQEGGKRIPDESEMEVHLKDVLSLWLKLHMWV